MKIKWLGHSCFKIISEKGIEMVTDPFDNTVGYKVPNVTADIVTVSHDHFDHNFTEAIEGNFEIVNKIGDFYIRDINIRGISSHHDKFEGKKRGENIIFTFNVDGMKVCHLGDLGHLLDDREIAEIGGVDVLLIPVGGNFTIDAEEAFKVMKQLDPRIVIPMHFKTRAINFPIDTVDTFLKKVGGGEKLASTALEVCNHDLQGEKKVYVLSYE